MVLAAGIAAVATVGSAVISSQAAKSAAKTQARAVENAAQAQLAQYEQTREDIAPYRELGYRALVPLESLAQQPFQYGAFAAPEPKFVAPTAQTLQEDPGYQFRVQEGQRDLERSAAGRGILQSGPTLKAITQYGQELGSQEYANAYGRAQATYGRDVEAYNRAMGRYQLGYDVGQGLRGRQFNELATLAGIGQTSTSTLAGLGAQYAGQQGELSMQRGNALAAGQVGQANAYAAGFGGIGNIANQYGQYQFLNTLYGQGGRTGGNQNPVVMYQPPSAYYQGTPSYTENPVPSYYGE